MPKRAWVTLLTRTSYLAGAIVLAYTLHKHESKHPLIILITPDFPSNLLPTLQREASLTNAQIRLIEHLRPREKFDLIDSRFDDTWTKLMVFSLVECEKLVFLDADMLVRRNMDELFDVELPGRDWIAAVHSCVCNGDRDNWAFGIGKQDPCAFEGLVHPTALAEPRRVPTAKEVESGKGKTTHVLFNSGLFTFTPSPALWTAMLAFFNTTPLLKSMLFADQDFLSEFFRDKWTALGYQYNATKSMRWWHKDMWRDAEVRNFHYVVDKPWAERVGRDGRAGFLGADGVVHLWWWAEFGAWERERECAGEVEVLEMGRGVVAKPLDEEGSASSGMGACSSRASSGEIG
jgi:inositol 3-alpha-galactosyltransferase